MGGALERWRYRYGGCGLRGRLPMVVRGGALLMAGGGGGGRLCRWAEALWPGC